jgi:phage-related protein
MTPKFDVLFMEDVREFLSFVDQKSKDKIIYNIDRAKLHSDKELFKKLKGEIWEFRTLYNKTYYRLFAFWDKSDKEETLVISTHGIIKKTDKVPEKEIEKAELLRQKYFKSKTK